MGCAKHTKIDLSPWISCWFWSASGRKKYHSFEEDDKKLEKIYNDYRSGKLLTSELKQILIDKLNKFLKIHQASREKAKKLVDKFIFKE